jgi:phosphoglycerol transferase MdoB-like AlkP superfamily enzyme
MKTTQNQLDRQPESERLGKMRKRAIDQLAYGSIILLWGSLLALKQVGIIQKNISTWPFPLTAFGILLVAASIYKLSKPRRM